MPAAEWEMEQWASGAAIIAVRSQGPREGWPINEIRCAVSSLCTGAQALSEPSSNAGCLRTADTGCGMFHSG